MESERPLTTGDVSRHCHVTHACVIEWIKNGKLRAYRTPGGHYRVNKQEFMKFLSEHHMPMSEELLASRSKRILIVDDDPAVVEIINRALKQDSDLYEIAEAYDGYEAGIQVEAFKPHLIILDLVMPHMDGFAVCRKIKSNPRTKKIKILAITGANLEDNAERILASGVEKILRKPLAIPQLRDEVARIMGMKKVASTKALGMERRKWLRPAISVPVNLSYYNSGLDGRELVRAKAKTFNISNEGVGLVCSARPQIFGFVDLEIMLEKKGPPVTAVGQLRWAKEVNDVAKKYRLGFYFAHIGEESRKKVTEYILGSTKLSLATA